MVVLVPTDAAIATARSHSPQSFIDAGSIRALVEYHVLLDTHPSASISNVSQFIPTLLNNTAYTNVTGGQRVELVQKDGPAALSALKAESRIIQPDIFYLGGLIHVIDSVLQIPLSFPSTVTRGNLTYIVALLNKGNLLTPNSVAYKVAIETPDLTFVGPNNPEYGSDFTGWDGLSQNELDRLFLYHAIPELVYTTSMKNNSQLMTLANMTLTARNYAGNGQSAIFFDESHVSISNYLTSNGVLQVVDRPLNLSSPNAAPSISDVHRILGIVDLPAKTGLSSGAIAGIVVGVLLAITLLGLVVFLIIRYQRAKERRMLTVKGAISSSTYRPQPPDYQSVTLDQHKAHDAQNTRASALIPPNTTSTDRSLSNRPTSFARSIRGAFFPSRMPAHALVELEASASEKNMAATKNISAASSSASGGSRPPVTCASSIYSVAEGRPSFESTNDPVPPLPRKASGHESVVEKRHKQTSSQSRVSMPLDAEMLRHIVYQDKE